MMGNDAFVDSRLRNGHRVDLPSILQPVPDRIEIATCQPIVFGNRLITQARLVKKRRIETQIIYLERRQPMPRRQADIHRDAGADKENGFPGDNGPGNGGSGLLGKTVAAQPRDGNSGCFVAAGQEVASDHG